MHRARYLGNLEIDDLLQTPPVTSASWAKWMDGTRAKALELFSEIYKEPGERTDHLSAAIQALVARHLRARRRAPGRVGPVTASRASTNGFRARPLPDDSVAVTDVVPRAFR